MANQIEIRHTGFTKWTPWRERKNVACYNQVGVYALLHLKKGEHPPTGGADARDERVIYIGLSHKKQSFRARWGPFNVAAFGSGNGPHSGGKTYRRRIGDKGSSLYVAARPIEYENTEIRDALIMHIERKLIWEYVRKNKHLPRCNKE